MCTFVRMSEGERESKRKRRRERRCWREGKSVYEREIEERGRER